MLAWALPAPQARRVASRSGGLGRGAVTPHQRRSLRTAAFDLCSVRVEGARLTASGTTPAVPASLVRPRPEPRYARHPHHARCAERCPLDPTTPPSCSLSSFGDLATPLGALAVLRGVSRVAQLKAAGYQVSGHGGPVSDGPEGTAHSSRRGAIRKVFCPQGTERCASVPPPSCTGARYPAARARDAGRVARKHLLIREETTY